MERKITQNNYGTNSSSKYNEGDDKSLNVSIKTSLFTKERVVSGIIGAVAGGIILLLIEYIFFQSNC